MYPNMATAIGRKILCVTCQKAAGVFTCRGCGSDFCHRHVAEHRQELSKQMDKLTTNHDQLRQTIADQEAEPLCHPLIKKIDIWEQESINKIRQAAADARKQVLGIIGTYKTQVLDDLGLLATELKKARDEEDYVETDLQTWKEKLDKVQMDFSEEQLIDFSQNDSELALIPKLFINDASTDVFYQTAGCLEIQEGGKVVVHSRTNGFGVVRCRGEYLSGQHRFRIKIEESQYGANFPCGIVSKNTPAGSMLISQNLNHNVLFGFIQRTETFIEGYTYEILIDCKQKMLRLTNEQTREISERDINSATTTCSFPWQFFIAMLHPNGRVRLC